MSPRERIAAFRAQGCTAPGCTNQRRTGTLCDRHARGGLPRCTLCGRRVLRGGSICSAHDDRSEYHRKRFDAHASRGCVARGCANRRRAWRPWCSEHRPRFDHSEVMP